jgi:putative membrane protein
MLAEIILAIILGISAGVFTGLIPGIHINLIGVSLVSLYSTLFFKIEPLFLVVFIVAMAITHTFLDFIPSIFFGCPDTDTELSVLPGHELLKKGQGYEAVILTCYGSLAAIAVLLIISFPSLLVIEKISNFIKPILPYILILVSLILILLERKKFSAVLVFLLTGSLGLIVLNMPSINQPILPLLSGLFGSSMLILSLKNKTKIPKQKIKKVRIKFWKPLLGATVAAPLCSFLPGLGSGQAAILGNTISKSNRKNFLFLLGATNTLVMGFSFLTLYTLSRTRTGAAVAISELIGSFNWKILLLILFVILISGIISFFITKFLAKKISLKISEINYSFFSWLMLGMLCLVILGVSGFFGLIIFAISTITGLYCISLNVKRANMMGCLLIPTILFYLFSV